MAASVFSSGRRITRSQQGALNTTAKKYPLRQSRSSGSDIEANGKNSSVFNGYLMLYVVTLVCKEEIYKQRNLLLGERRGTEMRSSRGHEKGWGEK